MIYLRLVYCIFHAYFCIFIQFYCICPQPGFSAKASVPQVHSVRPGMPMAAQVPQWPTSLDPSQSSHTTSTLGTTTLPAPAPLKSPWWTAECHCSHYSQHMQTKSFQLKAKWNKDKQGSLHYQLHWWTQEGSASARGTIDDLTHGLHWTPKLKGRNKISFLIWQNKLVSSSSYLLPHHCN